MKINTQSIASTINKTFLAFVAVLTVSSGLFGTPTASAQTCGTTTTPPTTYGQVTQTVNVATAGTYRVWSRIKVPNTTNNSYYLQFDNGCAINVGDATTIPANTWTWVSYQGGSTTNVINVTLTAGSHQLKYTGKEADVQLDRVLLLGDTACVPDGMGGNCADVDAVNPTVSMTAPAVGSSVQAGTPVTLSATASDNIGVTKVEFLVNNEVVNTDTTAPYSFSWPTAGVAAGAKSLTARAFDAANNSTTSAAVSMTVTAPPAVDTTQPNVSLTAPATGSSAAVGATVTLSATASDNVGVTKVEFYNGSTLISTDITSPYSASWNTTGQPAGAKTLTARAYDAANNTRTSTAVTLNLTGGSTAMPGDVNGDNKVNAIDLSVLITHDGENYPAADFNKDGTVGAADLAILLNRWTW